MVVPRFTPVVAKLKLVMRPLVRVVDALV